MFIVPRMVFWISDVEIDLFTPYEAKLLRKLDGSDKDDSKICIMTVFKTIVNIEQTVCHHIDQSIIQSITLLLLSDVI